MATEDKRIDQLDPVSVLDLTSLLAMQQGNNAKKVALQQLLDYLMSQIDAGNAVLFVSQTLSDAQKEQARANIGAAAIGEGGGSAEGAVLFVAQDLTDEQKAQARKNIRCGSVGTQIGCVASGDYSSAEGYYTTAEGVCAHAEGGYNLAVAVYSHAEGLWCSAKGDGENHAEGHGTEASGQGAHSEGMYTKAKGWCSHSEGAYTIAEGGSQHVEGQYNIKDDEDYQDVGINRRKYVHIVGNGTADDARSNAHTLDWEGNAWYAGSVEGTAMILKSPGGKRFSVTVNDSGALTAEEIV